MTNFSAASCLDTPRLAAIFSKSKLALAINCSNWVEPGAASTPLARFTKLSLPIGARDNTFFSNASLASLNSLLY